MTDISKHSIRTLKEMARERSTVTELRTDPTGGFVQREIIKAKPHNFMMKLIHEIERLRENE